MKITEETIIGEAVANDYRTAGVFKSYGIDFCCKGNRTVASACEAKKINVNEMLENLEKATRVQESGSPDYKSWPADLLIDYIEKTHHRYVRNAIPELMQYLNRICQVHGEQHPELFKIAELFAGSAKDLSAHMEKEEQVLFPFVKAMVEAERDGKALVQPHFGTVQNPVEMMKHEHEAEGERFVEIEKLTNSYTPPAEACNTYRVAFSLLQEFENDLHHHIHLENNILFPQAIEMEKKFSVTAGV